nr:four-carbon acid sugar kinase family protein [uncultured Cohaesibacter sp.]
MSNSATPPLVITVADDLTGALDSGVEFAKCGLETYVATAATHVEAALSHKPQCLVINTASREIGEAKAHHIHRTLRAALGDDLTHSLLFKKVDSRLKGNIATEINGLVGHDKRQVIVAPAIPDMGRRHQAGILSGVGIDQPVAIAERCDGISSPIYVPDVTGQDDFTPAIDAASAGALFVGAKGMAQALAQHLIAKRPVGGNAKRPSQCLEGSLLAAIGSLDPITLRQIDSLMTCNLESLRHIKAPNGHVSDVITKKTTSLLLQLTKGDSTQDSAEVGERFTALAASIFKLNQYDSLFCCGGQTAQDLLEALSIPLLKLNGELFPGVPVSEALLDSRPFWLITKSGGFGDPDLLANLFARQFSTPKA